MSCPRPGLRCLLVLLFAAAAQAQTFSVVYNFGSSSTDPTQPFYSGIIAQGRDGNLYSSSFGFNSVTGAEGVAFKITPAGVLTSLAGFSGVDGVLPYSGLTLGTDGNFYGAAYSGGFTTLAPYGTVFQMTPAGTLNILYTFTDGTDGALPMAPPVEGPDGNYYGTTCPGCNGEGGYGSIYKITPSGIFSLLYAFDNAHGANPNDPLVFGADGNFYGTTEFGGANGAGEVFKISPAGVPALLHSFDAANGELPIAPLIQASDGNFYGTTTNGGTHGYGVVFRMSPAGKFSIVHEMNGTSDGGAPYAGLVQATDGNLYGVNSSGGAIGPGCPAGCGTIYRITSKGVYSVVYNFDQTTGETPYSTMFQHTNGILYGMTNQGGTGSAVLCNVGQCGVFYSLDIGAVPFVTLLPYSAKVGNTIEILGQGFTDLTSVAFSGHAATYKIYSDTFMTATVPAGTITGSLTVTTRNGLLKSAKPFRVAPQIKAFKPASGPVATAVTIAGVSLTQTTKVTFNGVVAKFTVNSDTQVTATVPAGATTGAIIITTPGGMISTATPFTVN